MVFALFLFAPELARGDYCIASTCLCWWRGAAVERRSLAGELSRSHARPSADGGQPTRSTQPVILSGSINEMFATSIGGGAIW